jgi:hypothetical protein
VFSGPPEKSTVVLLSQMSDNGTLDSVFLTSMRSRSISGYRELGVLKGRGA